MITVRYFGSLKETVGRSADKLEIENAQNVSEVWQFVNPNIPLAENILTSVNMEYVPRNHAIQNGDEVAFFPPVTGG